MHFDWFPCSEGMSQQGACRMPAVGCWFMSRCPSCSRSDIDFPWHFLARWHVPRVFYFISFFMYLECLRFDGEVDLFVIRIELAWVFGDEVGDEEQRHFK